MVVMFRLRVTSGRRAAGLLALGLLAACQTPEPVAVNATFVATPAFSTRGPSQIAVLAIEDGTLKSDPAMGGPATGLSDRFLVFLRQEVMRQLPDRLFTPLTAMVVDAELRKLPAEAPGQSIMVPATLKKLAGHAGEDAVLALRVDRWDETNLPVSRRVWFQFQASLVGNDGAPLWSGSLQGQVRAGGASASPRDREAMARSCAELAVREMMLRLPQRVL